MIVLKAGTYQSDEMALAEDNSVLEELASAAADPAFGHRILPRTTISRSGRLDAHGLGGSHHGGTEDRVLIEDEMPGRGVVRERLAQLLDYPGGRRIRGDVEVHDSSSPMLDNEQDIANPTSAWVIQQLHEAFRMAGHVVVYANVYALY